jgi:ubiquinone/menaquinone biosynthesis C-methylase UbiE
MAADDDVSRWLAERCPALLEAVGLRRGQRVLDFGCNKGNYSLAAARVVGPTGRVVSVDKNRDALKELADTAKQRGLANIECLHVPEAERLPLETSSVDVALLYDVYHRGYAPEPGQRRQVLRAIHRVLRRGGALSMYPTHLRQFGMTFTQVRRELAEAGFRLRQVRRHRLVHDGRLVRGRVLSLTVP